MSSRTIVRVPGTFARELLLSVLLAASLLLWSFLMVDVLQAEPSTAADEFEPTRRQYTYAWMFSNADTMKPRGGTSRGPTVTLDEDVSPAFIALQAPELSVKERDRRAVLTMVGDYRTSFDFIETAGFTPEYTPQRPYQSWGTERVYLVADDPDFISLQHIIVMHFRNEDGSLSEPVVVKHWRQDWRYQDRDVHEFSGQRRWEKRQLARSDARGTWTQTVYQVDDSPRYEAVGRWVHAPGVSFWESDAMRRPLPRREFSVRDDYHALYGTHRISVYPGGWIQEEDALKLALDAQNDPVAELPYLAREAGISRYERLLDYDFSAGDAYWQETSAFWAEVRAYWDALYASQDTFSLQDSADGMPMFMALFTLAEQTGVSLEQKKQAMEDTLALYVRR